LWCFWSTNVITFSPPKKSPSVGQTLLKTPRWPSLWAQKKLGVPRLSGAPPLSFALFPRGYIFLKNPFGLFFNPFIPFLQLKGFKGGSGQTRGALFFWCAKGPPPSFFSTHPALVPCAEPPEHLTLDPQQTLPPFLWKCNHTVNPSNPWGVDLFFFHALWGSKPNPFFLLDGNSVPWDFNRLGCFSRRQSPDPLVPSSLFRCSN